MKSRLMPAICCLATTLFVGIWLGQTLPFNRDASEEIVRQATVSPYNSDGWQLAMGQQTGPAATLSPDLPSERDPITDPAVHPATGESADTIENSAEPDIEYFPASIVEAAAETPSGASIIPAQSSDHETPLVAQDADSIWKAQLSDLPPEQADEILQLRQQLGSIAAESLGFPTIPETSHETPGLFPQLAGDEARPIPIAGLSPTEEPVTHASAETESPLARSLREEIERNYAENIANVRTPGYKRRQIILLNVSPENPEEATIQQEQAVHAAAEASEVKLDEVSPSEIKVNPWLSRLDLREGKMTPTSNPLDIALSGKGWLKVEQNGKHEFVRTGMLGFGRKGLLGIHTAAGLLPIVPKVQIPVEQQRLIIAETGEVFSEKEMASPTADGTAPLITKLVVFNFRNASALKRTPFGTYSTTAESGDAEPAMPNTVRFLQGVLEESNVDRESEISEAGALNDAVERF